MGGDDKQEVQRLEQELQETPPEEATAMHLFMGFLSGCRLPTKRQRAKHVGGVPKKKRQDQYIFSVVTCPKRAFCINLFW